MRTRSKSKEVSVSRYRHERYNWVVRYPDGGKRKASYFKLKREAEAFQAEKEVELSRHGETLLADEEASAVRDYKEEIASLGGNIRDGLKLYVESLKRDQKSILVEDMVSRYIDDANHRGLSKRHIEDLRSRLGNKFVDTFKGRWISSLTGDELRQWMTEAGPSPKSFNKCRALVNALFRMAISEQRCKENPVLSIKPKKIVKGKVAILTPSELTRLLNVANEIDGEMVPFIALQALAGMRDSEAKKIRWEAIHLTRGLIYISADVAKSNEPRWTKIEPCLHSWLSLHRKLRGKVCPKNARKRLEAIREAAGFDDWQATHNNALRHSFGSYHLAMFSDAGKTREEMGHTDEPSFRKDYRERVLPEDAQAYWATMPTNESSRVIEIAL